MKFNDVTTDKLGIIILEPTEILGKASRAVEMVRIEGSHANKYRELGFQSVNKSLIVQIIDIDKVDKVLSTFNGKVKIEYNGRFTFGYFYEQINIERMIYLRKATLNFEREPFWYKEDEFSEDSKNEGNVFSQPILRIEKTDSSNVDLSINDVRFKYEFPENETYVEFDCETGNAYFDGLLRNRNFVIGFKLPKLLPGSNVVLNHSGNSIVKFRRKDRWL